MPTLQLRIRAFTVDPYLTFKLVPGGRWLLATAEGASVWYYDLDSEEPEQKVLIQPSEDIEGSDQDIAGLEINVEVSTSGLHFDLVLRTKGVCSNYLKLGFPQCPSFTFQEIQVLLPLCGCMYGGSRSRVVVL